MGVRGRYSAAGAADGRYSVTDAQMFYAAKYLLLKACSLFLGKISIELVARLNIRLLTLSRDRASFSHNLAYS